MKDEREEKPNKEAKYDDDYEEQVSTTTIATRNSIHHPFRMKGMSLRGQKVITSMDSGASHDFISEKLVSKRKLEPKNIKGFSAAMGTRALIKCTRKVPQLDLLVGMHPIKENFYVVPLDLDIILGTPWIYSWDAFCLIYQI